MVGHSGEHLRLSDARLMSVGERLTSVDERLMPDGEWLTSVDERLMPVGEWLTSVDERQLDVRLTLTLISYNITQNRPCVVTRNATLLHRRHASDVCISSCFSNRKCYFNIIPILFII